MTGIDYFLMASQIAVVAYVLLWAKRTTFSLARLFAVVALAALICLIYRTVDRDAGLLTSALLMFIVAIVCKQRGDQGVARVAFVGIVFLAIYLWKHSY